jgi:hypothetical protein
MAKSHGDDFDAMAKCPHERDKRFRADLGVRPGRSRVALTALVGFAIQLLHLGLRHTLMQGLGHVSSRSARSWKSRRQERRRDNRDRLKTLNPHAVGTRESVFSSGVFKLHPCYLHCFLCVLLACQQSVLFLLLLVQLAAER